MTDTLDILHALHALADDLRNAHPDGVHDVAVLEDELPTIEAPVRRVDGGTGTLVLMPLEDGTVDALLVAEDDTTYRWASDATATAVLERLNRGAWALLELEDDSETMELDARTAWLADGLDLPAPIVTDWKAGPIACIRVGALWLVVGGDEMSERAGDGGWIGFGIYTTGDDPANPDDAEHDGEVIVDTWDEARARFRAIVAEQTGRPGEDVPTFGIPYARAELVDGTLVHVCPTCGKHIAEDTDPTGETTTNHYGEHHEAEHESERRA